MAEPVSIITLNENIKGKYNYNKGSKFIYFVGERIGQRNTNAMFGILPNELSDSISIIFTEYFPSDRIFTEEGFALHEQFVWEKNRRIKIMIRSCMNCIWCSCRNYGYNRPICLNYIPEKFIGEDNKNETNM